MNKYQIIKYAFVKNGDLTRIHAPIIGTPDMFRKAIDFKDASLWDSESEIREFWTNACKLPLLKNLPDGIEIVKLTINIESIPIN